MYHSEIKENMVALKLDCGIEDNSNTKKFMTTWEIMFEPVDGDVLFKTVCRLSYWLVYFQ